jgi:ABC-2 type transport system ATP-binding protein
VIDLRVDGSRDTLAESLGRLPHVTSVAETPDGLRLLTSSRENMLQQVVEAARGHAIADLSVREPTLETVFIELTGRALRD